MRLAIILAAATLVLLAIAYLRPPEYDEAYSIFLTAGDPHPGWPVHPFQAADVRHFFAGTSTASAIAQNLRRLDVHPPLYFWALSLWRQVFGPSWLTARLLSVLFSLATLAILARAARLAEIAVLPALLITLLAYAFPYTGTIARNFALAQLLNMAGLYLTLAGTKRFHGMARGKEGVHGPALPEAGGWRLMTASGLCFSAASFTNYLAVFTALATLIWLTIRHVRRPSHFFLAGFAAFLPADAYFFVAQHGSRQGQFAPFQPGAALALIAKDAGAAIFGGLPLYAAPFTTPVAAVLIIFFIICLAIAAKPPLFAMTALATPVGLFLLGLVFNNTPIEIRYLAFSIPSLALILASLPRPLHATLILLESLGTFGLAFAPATMQPQALAAREAAALSTPATLTLVSYGNDGVGIPGPFITAAPDALSIQLIKSAPPLAQLPPHIILATITADDASRSTVAATMAALAASPCWRRTAMTAHTQSFMQICTPH
jgi:hypothetical protein